MPTLGTTITPLAGGLTGSAGTGEDVNVAFLNTWDTNDKFTLLVINNTTAVQVGFGAGQVTGVIPNFAFTFLDKVYFLAGASVFFSTEGQPTLFNDVYSTSPTDGFVGMSNQYSAPENLQAIASYQGRLAFFSRNTIQIWQTDTNPALWANTQILANTGTMAPLSVQSVGDLDVLYLNDSGVRSLRPRVTDLNAYVDDVGSPIDALITAGLIADANNGALACGVVEPTANRYWLYLNGVIYVRSEFPSSKVKAWTTYTPTFFLAGIQTTFVPQKFVVLGGRVYCLGTAGGSTYVLLFGGTNNTSYDATQCIGQIPFLDCGSPGTMKSSVRLDMLMTGTWILKGSMNIYDNNLNTFKTIIPATNVATTESGGIFPYTDRGTHFSLWFSSTDAAAVKMSSLIFQFKKQNNI